MILNQDENDFKMSLKYQCPNWDDLINKTNFQFIDTGKYSFYYENAVQRNWNQLAIVITIQSDAKTLDQWKQISNSNLKQLLSNFDDSLSENQKYEVVEIKFKLSDSQSAFEMSDSLEEKINMIATRKETFDKRPVDEKLGLLNNTIENILNKSGKYKSVNEKYFFGLLTDDNIKDFRSETHVFRHGNDKSISKRKEMDDNQKQFLVNYGTMIVIALFEYMD